MKKDTNNNYFFIAIVAIVAIVGMTFMAMNVGSKYSSQDATYAISEAEGDLAGQAVKAVAKAVPRDTIPELECYSDADCDGDLVCVKNMCVMPIVPEEPTTPLIHTRFWRVQKIDELTSPNILNFYTQIFYSTELETYLQGSSLLRYCNYEADDFSQSDEEYDPRYLTTNYNYGSSRESNVIKTNTGSFYFACSYVSGNSLIAEYLDYTKKQLPVFDEVRFLKDMLTGEYILEVKAHSNELIDSFSYSFYQGNGGFGIGYSPNSYTIDQEFKINYNETLDASISIDIVTNIKKTDIFYVDLASYMYFKITPSKSIENIEGREYLVYNLESIDVSPTEMEELKEKIVVTQI